MARPLTWRDLTLGIVGIAAVIGITVSILLFARVGGVRGRKAPVYVLAAGATGVLKGTEVTIAGKRAGTVEEIRFLQPSADTTARLLLKLEMLESALPVLRRDSYAQIHPSGTIIGAPVIDLAAGTTSSAAIRAGDTLRSMGQIAAETMGDRIAGLGRESGAAIDDFRAIAANIRSARSSFGAMDVAVGTDLPAFRVRARSLSQRMARSPAPAGTRGNDLGRRTTRVLAAMDSIAALLSSETGMVGRFRRDGTLATEMEKTRAELAAVRAALIGGRGSAGRTQYDRALARELTEVTNQFDLLIEDVKKNPVRYLSF